MDFKTTWKKHKALEKFEKENISKEKLVKKVIQALSTAYVEADKKLEDIADCCKDKEDNVR